ncbi:MAG: hypothetical protein ACXWNZ_03030 [Vulcanimicrobiaceae bacterium]
MKRLSLPPLVLAAVTLAGCGHIKLATGGVVPTPTPSASSSPAPGACGSAAANTTVVVAMGAQITATTDPGYGTIDGYATTDVNLQVNNVASVITVHPTDVVQFVNVENGEPGNIVHSAVGLGAQFPPVPYAFPATAGTANGSTITDPAVPWSTGDLAPLTPTGYCFSQTFVFTKPGKYYFGDRGYYNTTNMRDVIVVQ